MIGNTNNSLSITEIHNRQKKEGPHSVKEAAGIAYSFIRKTPNRNRSQIVQQLIEELGFTEIEASQGLRYLEDHEEIFLVQDSGTLKILLYKDTPSFEKEQKQSQDSWIKARQEGNC